MLAAACTLLALAGGESLVQPAVKARPTTLSVSQGPRGGNLKRVFNPFRGDSDTRWPATAGVYEPLLVYSRATRTYLPWLATAYQWGAGNLALQFTVRSGVSWSDGTRFTGRDVAFTFDLMRRHPALDRAGVWAFLASAGSADGTTVEFTFKKPYTPGFLAIATQPIVAEHKWRDVAQPAAFDDPSPVGTGPFVEVRRFEPTVYELARNARYWQRDKPAVDLLRVPLFRTNEDLLKALARGEVDWASLFVEDVEKRWAATDPSRHLFWYPDIGQTVLLQLNTRRKPFDDPAVRKALSIALDRPRISREAMNGYAPPADATGLPESQARWKDPALAQKGDWTRRDLARASALLDGAGFVRTAGGTRTGPGGAPMRYELNVVDGWSDWMAAAAIMRENLAEIGVDVAIKPLAYEAWIGAIERGRFDMGIWFGDRGPTPYEFYRSQMDTALVKPIGEKATANYHRFGSDEASLLLRGFEASSDDSEQTRLARQLQAIYVESAPSLPLFASPLWGVFNTTRIVGFPSRFNPYAGAAPGAQSDTLPVLVTVKPR